MLRTAAARASRSGHQQGALLERALEGLGDHGILGNMVEQYGGNIHSGHVIWNYHDII